MDLYLLVLLEVYFVWYLLIMFYKNPVTGMSIISVLYLVFSQLACVEYYFKWTIGLNLDSIRHGVFTVKFVWLELEFISLVIWFTIWYGHMSTVLQKRKNLSFECQVQRLVFSVETWLGRFKIPKISQICREKWQFLN